VSKKIIKKTKYRVAMYDIPEDVVKACIKRMRKTDFRLRDIRDAARDAGCPEPIAHILARRLLLKFKRDGLIKKIGKIHWRFSQK